jgi:small redox-active disulfide protein 2
MKIKILGTGCPKCRKLHAEVEKAISASGVALEVEKIEEIDDIVEYGVVMTPCLVIDDEVKSSGRIPSAAEITAWITATTATNDP